MENLSRVFQDKKEKKHLKKLSFKTQFKTELLLTFTGCRKMLVKMPVSKLFDVVGEN